LVNDVENIFADDVENEESKMHLQMMLKMFL
jgi:hypothetical protein